MRTIPTREQFSWQAHGIRMILLLVATAVIVYFMPREGKFRYEFQEGKPWRYGLLTASFDFPIYKTDAEIKAESDSIFHQFYPYYSINPNAENRELEQFANDYQSELKQTLSLDNYRYFHDQIRKAYQQGIISSEEKNELERKKVPAIRVVNNNISKLYASNSLKTDRDVYKEIMQGLDSRRQIHNFDLSKYLKPNIHFDALMTERVKSELSQSISIYNGLVQTGERIVDRGEIIDQNTYNILRSLDIASQARAGTAREQSLTVMSLSLFIFLFIGSNLFFLYLFKFENYVNLRDVSLLLLMITFMCVACSAIGYFRLLSIYLVPFAMVPIVLRSFLNSRIALFAHITTIIICGFMAPFAFELIVIQLAVGITSVLSLRELTQRSQLAKVSVFVFFVSCIVYTCYTLIQEGNWDKINVTMYLYFFINAILLLFTYLFIFILERMLGFTSNVTLVELSNINSPLLRKLSEECPGSFQHSIQISNLCALAARQIGANEQLVRTGALYHDIGKLSNPSFFTENQQGINPHNNLTTEQSVIIIKQHVFDGIKLAQREKLPREIIDFIKTHHGKGRIRYFYNRWKNEHENEQIDESVFEYPGPNPHTKEQAILMITDCVEAASRSLKEYSEETCRTLITSLIDGLIHEGLLSDASLTLRDLETIKQVYIERLLTVYHTRVSYPELKKENA